MIVLNSLESRGGFISVMSQFLDEAGLALFWKKMTDKLSAQTVAEKNTQLVEKDITSMYTDGSLFENIKNGSFDGINPGNYFNARLKTSDGDTTNASLLVLELDRYYGKSDNIGNSKTEHHIVVTFKELPDNSVLTMNSSNTNNGGYVGSYLFKSIFPVIDSGLQLSFGDHLKTVSLNLSNTGYDQKPYTYVNTIVRSYLFTEYELFGKIICDDEKYTAYPQYAAFKLDSSLITNGMFYWERSIPGFDTSFCRVIYDYNPRKNFYYASSEPLTASSTTGLRFGFLLG